MERFRLELDIDDLPHDNDTLIAETLWLFEIIFTAVPAR
jgi:hypothetical protein